MIFPLLAIGALVCIIMYARGAPKGSDPYGEFHLVLNKRDGDVGRPSTEWLNMGYWKTERSFPKACEALALLLYKKAGLKPHDKVLDVGHGCGDSLLVLLSHPDIPRPDVVYGITSLLAHHQRSQARVSQLLASDPTLAARTQVELFKGDAVWRHEKDHPLAADSGQLLHAILALDCAYHFNTRGTFLSQSYSHLKPGGRITLADICFDAKPSSFVAFFLSTVMRAMPRANVQSKSEYIAVMEAIGYTDVTVEDITEDVFPGFARFLSTQKIAFRLLAKGIILLQALGARFVIVKGTRPSSSSST